eukprot:Partr_v1_DN28531_c1_g1_i3_m73079 putative GTPase Activating protein
MESRTSSIPEEVPCRKILSTHEIVQSMARLKTSVNVAVDIHDRMSGNNSDLGLSSSKAMSPLLANVDAENSAMYRSMDRAGFNLSETDSVGSSTRASKTGHRSKKKSKARTSPQLLHKRIRNSLIPEPTIQVKDAISPVAIDRFILSSGVPQWLIYSWLSRAKDSNIADKKTQIFVSEILNLKHYSVLVALCYSASLSDQDEIAKTVLKALAAMNDIKKAPELKRSILEGTDESLSRGLAHKDHVSSFLGLMIDLELKESSNETTLFRSNNIVSKLLSYYASPSRKYYMSVLRPVLEKVATFGNMEVDPSKILRPPMTEQEASEIANVNMKKLINAANMVLAALFASADSAPAELCRISKMICSQLDGKFGKTTPSGDQEANDDTTARTRNQSTFTGFLFLRFICPLLITPEFQEGQQVSDPILRRNCILISKLIQNAANGIKFGGKEDYMKGANDFVIDSESKVREYSKLLQTARGNLVETSDTITTASEPRMVNQWMILLETCRKHMERMLERLDQAVVVENMTFNVLGALKAVLRRFESVEKAISTKEPHHTIAPHLYFGERDERLVRQFVLLSGLEEVLLMNKFILLKILMDPSNFTAGVPFTMDLPIDTGDRIIQRREMDLIARSVAYIVAPHGSMKLFELFLWNWRQELALAEKHGLNKREYANILIDPQSFNTRKQAVDRLLDMSIANRFMSSFLVAHVNDVITMEMQKALQSFNSLTNYEIDPEQVVSDATLSSNLETLMDCAFMILDKISSTTKITDSLRMFCTTLYDSANDVPFLSLESPATNCKLLASIGKLVFRKLFVTAVSAPLHFKLLRNDANPRVYALIGHLLHYLAGIPETAADLNPVRMRVEKSMKDFSTILFSHLPSNSYPDLPIPEPCPLADDGTPKKSDASLASFSSSLTNTPLYTSSSHRAKSLVYIRKILTAPVVKKLKENAEFADTPTDKDSATKRSERVQYKLGDRVRCLFWSLNGLDGTSNEAGDRPIEMKDIQQPHDDNPSPQQENLQKLRDTHSGFDTIKRVDTSERKWIPSTGAYSVVRSVLGLMKHSSEVATFNTFEEPSSPRQGTQKDKKS